MRHQRVDLLKLVASDQPRPLITEAVDKLASSIRDIGLIQPITVRQRSIMSGGLAEQGFQVVAGHHRVAACRALGWTEIDAIVIEAGEHLQAELIEIDENLCRSELTNSQRAKAVKRRKEIWEALHPVRQRFDSVFDALGTVEEHMTEAEGREELEVEPVIPPQVFSHGGARPQSKSFAASTADASGMTKQAINRHLARAEALGDDLDKVTGTSLDKGVELDALKAMTPEQRAPLIERAQAGECVSARDTLKPASPILTPSIRLQMALMHGIGRALESAGVRTAEELVAQIMALPVRERDFLANQLDVFEYVGCLGSNRGGA
jgi:ParB family chromosome partitioning protein